MLRARPGPRSKYKAVILGLLYRGATSVGLAAASPSKGSVGLDLAEPRRTSAWAAYPDVSSAGRRACRPASRARRRCRPGLGAYRPALANGRRRVWSADHPPAARPERLGQLGRDRADAAPLRAPATVAGLVAPLDRFHLDGVEDRLERVGRRRGEDVGDVG